LAFPSASWAQRSAASINGTVRDTTGAVIPQAAITLTNTQTNVTQTAVTNDTGEYVIQNILPGSYLLKAAKEGFQTATQPAITLEVNQTTTFDFTLPVGATTQTVTVEAAAAELETSTAEIGSVVTVKMVNDLPLNGRNFTQLLELTPGVSPISTAQNNGGWGGQPLGTFTFPSVNGQSNRSNLFLMDGVNNQGEFESTYNIAPQIDDIEEFKVQSHNDEAQFGGALGGIINLVTKGGTNSVHGDAFDFHRDRALDGRGFFLPSVDPKQAFTQNQFGGTFAGPVYIPHVYNGKNRTFYYLSYEGFRDHAASASLTRVPTPSELGGDLSDFSAQLYNPFSTTPDPAHPGYSLESPFLCSGGLPEPAVNGIQAPGGTPCNMIPSSMISPSALAYATSWPAPINTGSAGFNALDTSPYVQDQDEGSLRIDETLSSHDSFFVRYTALNQPVTNTGGFVGYKNDVYFHADNAAVTWTHSFAGSAVLDVSFGRNNAEYNNPEFYTNLPSNFLSNVGFSPTFAGNFIGGATAVPSVSITNFAGGGTNVSDTHMSDIYEWKGDFSKLHGRHTFKMGGDIAINNASALYENLSLSYANVETSCTFCYGYGGTAGAPVGGLAFASFLLNVPDSAGRRNVHETEHGGWIDGLYFQDMWKASDKLTVNLGLRYDVTIMPIYGNDKENTDTTGDIDFNNGTYVIQKAVPACNPPAVIAPCIPGGTLPAHVVIDPNSNHKTFANQTDNWQPRVGIAYRLKSALVFHASYGRFYDNWAAVTQTAQNTEGTWPQLGQLLANNLNHNTVPNVSMTDPFPGSAFVPSATPFISPGFVEWYMNPLQKNPYSDQWTVGFEQQLGTNTTITANYVGSHSSRMDVGGNWNVANVPGPGPIDTHPTSGPDAGATWTPDPRQPYPYIPPTFYDRDNGFANYNAFQFSMNHKTGKGLSYLLSYTYSKVINTGTDGWYGADGGAPQQPYDLNADKSVAGFDLTHILSFSWVYQLPFGKGMRFSTGSRALDYVVGNWQFNGLFFTSSGQPYNINSSGDIANTGNIEERANRLQGVATKANVGSPGSEGYAINWLNTAAFTPATTYTYGTEGRNDLRMDWPRNFDLSMFRSFPVSEAKRLEFRAEFFNAFNTPRFGQPDNTVGDQYFGQINSTANSARIIQLALKLYF
jgi:outer membrane receptor protein involved in Fe transport